ncbi:helix-turn-helix domain-containing protein [Amycolatopsis sp. EV170708-02-1]|uniref:helix-turn-helix domain-containing protein n=1 Tax=Amycolatopsis sp. EV170708-02-1 TaxID=2919322 RepID=UPI001F0C80A6|nr:hypothetical protein [Amycolatopsis sp. EV170708-02-1]UMP03302.1 hypothetical protein MJQ72_44540 [Amycolatopsis sp. EV170708-02-1]UMP03308.1 hypothetical protein MJQ72_00015 [Amycolatopsis sp. EV170708-02-1]UMP05416.1 hypothetical protein MJQ72_11560 [Amycolatopsis sp. EV170708-02-1]
MALDSDVVVELADRYVNEGRTIEGLAQQYGFSYRAVRTALLGAKVKLRPPKVPLPPAPPGLVNAYNGGHTIQQLADIHGMSCGQTRRVLLAEGVQLRPPGRQASTQWGADRISRY